MASQRWVTDDGKESFEDEISALRYDVAHWKARADTAENELAKNAAAKRRADDEERRQRHSGGHE